MADIVLHIGAGKCGSSAIQTALTKNPVLEKDDGTPLIFGTIDRKGSLVSGLQLGSATGIRGYHTSAHAQIAAFGERHIAAHRRQFDEIGNGTIVLSCEGWLKKSQAFQHVLAGWGEPVRVVAYVRPQVSYINAAWWQWGAWQDLSFEEWIARTLPSSFWGDLLRDWKDNPRVANLTIRPLPDDVVRDFFSVLGVKRHRPKTDRVNSSLPASILRLYQRNRRLRPSKTASQMDFVLARRLHIGGSAPWVLNREIVEHIIARSRPSNKKLLSMLGHKAKANVRRDARWWEANAFAEKTLEPWEPQPPSVEELELLCAEMAEAMLRMEKRSLRED